VTTSEPNGMCVATQWHVRHVLHVRNVAGEADHPTHASPASQATPSLHSTHAINREIEARLVSCRFHMGCISGMSAA
jgi:hypothetical protein